MLLPVNYPLTVFYDASCPMCVTEMHALRELDSKRRLILVDCSTPDFEADQYLSEGVSHDDLMKWIHARDASGRWLIGIDCFEAVYRAAGLEGVARIWGSPRLRRVLAGLYPWIARHRQLLSRLGINAIIRRLMPKPGLTNGCHDASCRSAGR
jgi:predicted DCC family thiol-disulfide oxidoreductase YuxK